MLAMTSLVTERGGVWAPKIIWMLFGFVVSCFRAENLSVMDNIE